LSWFLHKTLNRIFSFYQPPLPDLRVQTKKPAKTLKSLQAMFPILWYIILTLLSIVSDKNIRFAHETDYVSALVFVQLKHVRVRWGYWFDIWYDYCISSQIMVS
jgi:hypothetical protein